MGRDEGPESDKIHLQHVLIKWTGGKRRQARRIVEHFPLKIKTYHEPFLGGGAVLYELLGSDLQVDRIECGDTCVPLIELWQVVRDDPEGLVRRYAENWATLQSQGKDFYYEVRHEFNIANDPYNFFFLLRTCRNGLVRFNRDGEFNSGFHGDRPGMDPETVQSLAEYWKRRLASRDVRFAVRDYRQVATGEGDLLYLDPPYLNEDGQYYSGTIDFLEFFGWLRDQRGDYLLSLNGFLGDQDRTVAVPYDLYDEHLLLDNGVCPNHRLNGDPPPPVKDSLYIRRRSPVRVPEDIPPLATDSSHARPQKEVVNKSSEIRALLEAQPELTGPEVVRRMAERGMKVDANLVRVVRHNLRKSKTWAQAEEERRSRERQEGLAGLASSYLMKRTGEYRHAGVPHAGEVQVSINDLISLTTLIGGLVTWEQLAHAGHGLWMARYSQLTGMSPREAEAAIARHLIGQKSRPASAIKPPTPHAGHPDNGQAKMLRSFSFGEERDERPVHPVLPDWGTVIEEDEDDEFDEMEKLDRLRNMHKRWRH